MNTTWPGRSCPLHYRYQPEVFATEVPEHMQDLDVLYLVGGLYGNDLALERVLELFERESGRKRLVFNGDFHWLDTDPAVFASIQKQVLKHEALRGNVETELGAPGNPDGADCGCAYPAWVDQAVVDRSNRIFAQLQRQVTPEQRAELSALPPWQIANLGAMRLGIVHGDATSLAGWGFAQESLRDTSHLALVSSWLERAQVDAFASSHTCLPVFQALPSSRGTDRRWIFNNGSAGMPNFQGETSGLLTRMALTPFDGPEKRYAVKVNPQVHAEALAIDFDHAAWCARFLAQWPPGSEAYASYLDRIVKGPNYTLSEATGQRQVITDFCQLL